MFGKNIPRKTLQKLVIKIKRGLSSYYLQDEGDKVPFVNIRDVKNGRIDADFVERVHAKETSALENSKLEPRDVVVSIKGSTFRAAIADESVKGFVISANLIAFKLSEDALPEIVVAYLNSPMGQSDLHSISSGAIQKSINLRSLMGLKIPVPEKKRQKILAEYFILSKEHNELMNRERELRQKLDNSIILNYMMG